MICFSKLFPLLDFDKFITAVCLNSSVFLLSHFVLYALHICSHGKRRLSFTSNLCVHCKHLVHFTSQPVKLSMNENGLCCLLAVFYWH